MTGDQVAFALISVALLGGAIASVTARRTFHAVMFLGAVLVLMGALFILLGSALIGVIQVLVYVGGILTLFIFAVMFVTGDDEESEAGPARSEGFPLLGRLFVYLMAAGAALAVLAGLWMAITMRAPLAARLGVAFGALLFVGALVIYWKARWPIKFGFAVASVLFFGMLASVAYLDPWRGGASDEALAQANDTQGLVESLFGPDVIAFEVLGILLTAAMIGALVIARPMDAQADEDRYTHPTPEQVEQADRVSDPKHAPGMEGAR